MFFRRSGRLPAAHPLQSLQVFCQPLEGVLQLHGLKSEQNGTPNEPVGQRHE